MRVMFVYWPLDTAGSAVDMCHYARAARSLGHEAVVYGPPDARLSFDCSLDVRSADAIVFVLEWNLYLHHGGRLNLVRLLGDAPRARRVVIDCDGMYNDALTVCGDCNFLTAEASRLRSELYESLAPAILQPTLHPARSQVRSFLFHGYDTSWELPLDLRTKEFGMIYVGSTWFRWRPMVRVLKALEPIRARIGRIGLLGRGWESPWYADPRILPRDAFHVDVSYLKKLDVEVLPPVPFTRVVPWMSKAWINPIIYRPLFTHLQLVTCRTFETLAAGTIPLLDFSEAFARDIYGEQGKELVSGDRPTEKIIDILERPDHYARIVQDVRRHLAVHHSYTARFQQLLAILDGAEP